MDARELVREGRLADALTALQNDVRAAPADAKQRTFLFQLLAVMGQWDRALTQLNVAGEMDPSALPMMHTYRDAISSEVFRNQVMAGDRTPLLFGEPEQWLAMHLEAAKLSAQGQFEKAQELRGKAFEDAPAVGGKIDDEPFEWLADADSRLGPVLEMVVNGRYYWVPFHRISQLIFEPPTDLRDVVWKPAYITWANGGEIVGLVPCRYAGSAESADDQERLGRVTNWQDKGADEYHGLGQRLLTTDTGDFPLMDVTQINFDIETPADEPER
ncbi:MAG: type VI secretion system accessory protein TagJ [Gammaproteobacteria bacterium]